VRLAPDSGFHFVLEPFIEQVVQVDVGGSTLNFVFGDLLIIAFCKEEGDRRRCGNNGKAEAVFARAFPKSWRKSSKKKSLKVLCSKKKKAPGCCLEPKTRVINRLCSGANQ
jgi:hypothetical protein